MAKSAAKCGKTRKNAGLRTASAAAVLSVIFLIRTGVNVSRANGLKRKKNKLAHMYAAAPSLFFGNETALWGMDVTTCTIIALALVAVCVVCLV